MTTTRNKVVGNKTLSFFVFAFTSFLNVFFFMYYNCIYIKRILFRLSLFGYDIREKKVLIFG